MSLSFKLVLSVIFLVLVIATGIWLTSLGKPINTALFTVHKLLALAFAVFTAVLVIGLIKGAGVNMTLLLLIITAVLSIIALFASGAVLSMNKPAAEIFSIIHRLTPITVTISTFLILYILTRNN